MVSCAADHVSNYEKYQSDSNRQVSIHMPILTLVRLDYLVRPQAAGSLISAKVDIANWSVIPAM